MNRVHIEGAREIEKINIDFDNDFVRIFLDYLHIYQFSPGEKFGLHAHPNFEFHYIASGSGKIGLLNVDSLFKDESIVKRAGVSHSKNVEHLMEYYLSAVDERELESSCELYEVKAGDIFINRPGHFHWQKSSKENPIVEFSLRCSFDALPGKENSGGLIEDYIMINRLLHAGTKAFGRDEYSVRRHFELIFEEAYYKMPGYIIKIKQKLLELIISFARHIWDKKEVSYYVPAQNNVKRRLQMIDDYINANIQKNITIPELAQSVFMSERSLCRFIKQEVELTPHKYILNIRIDKALNLIANTSMKISEIAHLTGFSSQFHLSKVVKDKTGKSPTKFR
ncbi:MULTISPECIES: helix-turn-helix domain-containing protein [unclassified Carboxylicivirga]|uniref:helix-turn-helix domain-containing protein n=1 Tax=Carboxylicivirga TaxID=1628153 RepID=UPI003D35178E